MAELDLSVAPCVTHQDIDIALHLIGQRLLEQPSVDLLRAHFALAEWSGRLTALEAVHQFSQDQAGGAGHAGNPVAAVLMGV